MFVESLESRQFHSVTPGAAESRPVEVTPAAAMLALPQHRQLPAVQHGLAQAAGTPSVIFLPAVQR